MIVNQSAEIRNPNCFGLFMDSWFFSCWSSRVIDGGETLDDLEKIPVNEKTYKPLRDVRIQNIKIHANPIADMQS